MDELITYATAVKAFEHGFDWECIEHCFENDGKQIPRPTQTLLQRWLREVKNINVTVVHKINIKKWDYIVYDMNLTGEEYEIGQKKYREEVKCRIYDTYEEALEDGLLEAVYYLNSKELSADEPIVESWLDVYLKCKNITSAPSMTKTVIDWLAKNYKSPIKM
jgi:hypothetical protein